MATVLLAALLSFVSLNVNSSDYDKNYSLHGSRASFLMNDSRWMTLGFLHEDAAKNEMMNSALANGDTHFYIYSRNGGDNGGSMDLRYIEPKADWEAQIQKIIDRGLKPVMWLTPDDSPQLIGGMDTQKNHMTEMVRRFDKQVSAYVVCLECDEYWSAETVNKLVAHVKSQTNKPVAVHLTSGIGGHKGNLNYYKGADYVFLQFGWDKTPEQMKAMVKEAMKVTGLPVIASEYALESRTAAARALGDAACTAGAVGTGNGRSVTFCGEELVPPKKKDKTEEYLMIGGAVVGAAVLAYGVYWFNQNYDINLGFNFNITDDMQSIGLTKDFNLFEKNDTSLNFGIELGQTFSEEKNYSQVLFTLKGTF